jgi:hypothetical protein
MNTIEREREIQSVILRARGKAGQPKANQKTFHPTCFHADVPLRLRHLSFKSTTVRSWKYSPY